MLAATGCVFEKHGNLRGHYVTIATDGETNLSSFSASRISAQAAWPEAVGDPSAACMAPCRIGRNIARAIALARGTP
jgi:hypothetical protein